MKHAQLLKSILLAGGAASAFVETLTDDAALGAHLEKSEADRKAEVDAWVEKTKFGKPKDGDDKIEKADIAAIVKSAIADAVAPIQAELKKSQDELAELRKAGETTSIEKRAATEFKGVPQAAEILKGAAGLDAETRARIEDLMKAHGELAALTAPARGHAALAKDAKSATAQLNKAAEDLAAKDGTSFEVAFAKINEDPAYAELIAKADQEDAGLGAD